MTHIIKIETDKGDFIELEFKHENMRNLVASLMMSDSVKSDSNLGKVETYNLTWSDKRPYPFEKETDK